MSNARYVADDDHFTIVPIEEDLAKDSDDVWTYYYGPRGGEGWLNLRTGEKRYQKRRPGKAPEDGDGYGDWLAEGWGDPPEDPTDLHVGQTVEVEYDDEFHEATVTEIDDGVPMLDDEETDVPYEATMDDVDLTAVEQVESAEEIVAQGPTVEESQAKYEGEMTTDMDEAVPWVRAEDVQPGTTLTLLAESAPDSVDIPQDIPIPIIGYGKHGGEPVVDGDVLAEIYGIEDMQDTPISVGSQNFAEYDDDWKAIEIEESPVGGYPAVGENLPLDYEPGALMNRVPEGFDVSQMEIGDDVEIYDDHSDDVFEAEVVSPVDGRFAVEDEYGGTFFPVEDDDLEVTGASHMYVHGNEQPETVKPPGYISDGILEGAVDVRVDPEFDMTVYDGVYDGDVPDDPGDYPGAEVIVEDYETGAYAYGTVDEGGTFVDVEGSGQILNDDVNLRAVHEDEFQTVDEQVADEAVGEAVGTADDTDEPSVDYAEGDTIRWESYGKEYPATVIDPMPGHEAIRVRNEQDGEAYDVYPSEIVDDASPSTDAGTDPAATADDTGGYEPTEYHPDQAEQWDDLGSVGANHGNSMAAMEVAVLPDGTKMVHTHLDHPDASLEDAERQIAGWEALKHIDRSVTTDHAYDLSPGGWFANEEAPGVDAVDAKAEGYDDAVDYDDFVHLVATQIIIGNSDGHQNNVRVDAEGNLRAFDLDRSAGDVQGSWVGDYGASKGYTNTLDRIFGELEQTASALGITLDRQDALDRAEEIASDLDGSVTADIRDDVGSVNGEFAATIDANISALAQGEVQLP